MEQGSIIGRRLLIRGQVQGVGFRWHMVAAAQAAGVSGWVRNLRDGRVEALLCGAPDAVAAMLHWASTGPAHARVDELRVEESAERVQGFTQRSTV